MHANYDMGKRVLNYGIYDLIDHCKRLKFDVITITSHDRVFYSKTIADYAASRGILLISGCERTIGGRHVLLINVTDEIIKKINSYSDLERYKDENFAVVAAHPFFPGPYSVNKRLIRHIGAFDGIEFSHMYTKHINFNRKAVEIAKEYGKPLIGTSDCHTLAQIGHTYSLVDAEKKTRAIVDSIKDGKVRLKTTPLTILQAAKLFGHVIFGESKYH